MIILLNPNEPDGAPVKNVYHMDQLFFSEKENDIFAPGTVREFEDDLATFFKGLYTFLEEVDAPTAKKYLEKAKEVLACDKCDFKTSTPIALTGHKRKHVTEAELSGLGIPVVRKAENKVMDTTSEQERIESENTKDGLTLGDGLVEEHLGSGKLMS